MRRNAAARSENSLGSDHAAQVFRRRLDAGEHDVFASFRARDRFLGAENNMAAGRARSGGETAANFFCAPHGLTIKNWREQMRERIGRDTSHGVLFIN